jgi:glycosyltransferase involved in cell wall biosynthesis
MAADLQEPPRLIGQFFQALEGGGADVVFGTRESRSDPLFSRILSQTFWAIYRTLVTKDMPRGGIDVFGCNRVVRDQLVQLRESNTNLVALLLWLGYRRVFIPYTRAARIKGKSAWTIGKKIRYCLDSIFNFTDLPIRILLYLGLLGISLAFLAMVVVSTAKLLGKITVPGYSAIIIVIVFFGGVMSLGLGILGQYLWLTLNNARRRPNYIIANIEKWDRGSDREQVAVIAADSSGFGS